MTASHPSTIPVVPEVNSSVHIASLSITASKKFPVAVFHKLAATFPDQPVHQLRTPSLSSSAESMFILTVYEPAGSLQVPPSIFFSIFLPEKITSVYFRPALSDSPISICRKILVERHDHACTVGDREDMKRPTCSCSRLSLRSCCRGAPYAV